MDNQILRNQNFNARNPFTDIVPDPATGRSPGPGAFRQNQFGATIGGPVYLPKVYDGRRKTFFFFSYDGWRFRQSAANLYRAPTQEEIGGDFSGRKPIFDPATTREDPADPSTLIRDPFPNNRIPGNRFDPMITTYLQKYFDRPNLQGLPFDNVVNNEPIVNDANNWQIRFDHQLTANTNVFARYNEFNNLTTNPINLRSRERQHAPREQAVLALDHMFTPRTLLQLRSAWNGLPRSVGPSERPSAETLVQEGWVNVARFGDPIVRIDELGPSSLNTTLEEPTSVIQHSGDLSWVRGSHEFKFGGLFIRTGTRSTELTHLIPFEAEQTADPQRIGETGVALASALLGLPSGYSAQGGSTGVRYSSWGFYVQDSWKAAPRLTVNLGLRWDAVIPPKYTVFGGGNMDPIAGEFLIVSRTLPPPCSSGSPPPCIPGDGTLASIRDGDKIRLADPHNLWIGDYNNFGPRLGLAWQFRPKTVLRLGGAVLFDVLSAVIQQYTDAQFRWPSGFVCSGPDQPNSLGEPLISVGEIVRDCGEAEVESNPWGTGSGQERDKQKPQSYQYHLEFQHQVGDNLSASIAYVGSLNRRMDYGPERNAALFPAPGSRAEVNARRPFPHIRRNVKYMSDDGTGYYNALQFELNRRFSDGFMFLLSYTWSKSIDNGSTGFQGRSEGGPSRVIQNQYDRRVDRSVSSLNVPHLFSFSSTWEIPVGKEKRWLQSGPGAWILGNWRFDFIQSMRSGQPWNARIRGDVANVGVRRHYARPHVVGDWKLANPTAELWVNPAAYEIPRFEYGNLGRNTHRTDAVFSSDLALAKDFLISEAVRLEFRAESFNLFNVMSYGVPRIFLNRRDFGRITSLVELPRQFQFGMRLTF